MTSSGCQGKPQISITEVECPECGELVEMMTTDATAVCEECGATVVNDKMKCVFWCDHARECVGDEAYEAAMAAADRIEFDPVQFENITRW
ncbi:MAG: hypothetical protein Q4B03_01480 [Lachnospiraceae bacterium]|nr:hypothetical protein [Lachnospiraceae bacterium]